MNERKTEKLVRALLTATNYDADSAISVEEQASEIVAITKLLRKSSKKATGNKGSPEFIITSTAHSDFVVVIECKGNVAHHESAEHDQPIKYAVDGALHYAKYLAPLYNVIAIGASGQTASQLKVSTYLHPKGAEAPRPLTTKGNAAINSILPWADLIEHATFDPGIQRLRTSELMAFSRELHEFMRAHAKLTESEKPLLVSGTLIALKDRAFAKGYGDFDPDSLQRRWLQVIDEQLEKAQLPAAKRANVVQPYTTIAVHPELGKATKVYPKGILYELISMLDDKVWPFLSIYHDFDVVGQFYGEFLKYTGGDKKALGIVLTPRHITDLFSQVANVRRDTRVIDPCAGTGGFLISAMHHMMRQATTEAEKDAIKRDCLIGIEQQPNMFALAASNMILRGDGKANLYQGSCFDPDISASVKKKLREGNVRGHTVGMINPPYSQGSGDLHELYFVKEMLDDLTPGGTGLAIIPLPKVIAPHASKAELMRYHTLEAVMTMPGELFYPVGRATCIAVFTAHTPHVEADKDTWLAYWKDDGFVKTKHLGRTDLKGRWERIRQRWVKAFRNREVVAGQSLNRRLTPDDEWCAEAYMPTDYSLVSSRDLEARLKAYMAFGMMEEIFYAANVRRSDVDEDEQD